MTVILSVHTPNPTDATSLYRGVGPLASLERAEAGRYRMHYNPAINWASLKTVDAVFLQRPYDDVHMQVMKLSKCNNKPLWIDYDDDLYTVPVFNKARKIYGNQEIQNNITSMLCMADIVSVSTPVLQAKLQAIIENIRSAGENGRDLILDPRKVLVLPNAYDMETMSKIKNEDFPSHQNKLVCWRGSNTHDQDLWGVTRSLGRVMSKHLDWNYNFIGDPFWLTIDTLEKHVKNIQPKTILLTPTLDPAEYLQYLKTIAPALMIVPLEDMAFNRSKSNIAWLEATHAGAVTLAPDFEEWRRPGIINYKDAADFEVKMESFMRGEMDDELLWRQSRDFILENLQLKYVNEKRVAIINELLKSKS